MNSGLFSVTHICDTSHSALQNAVDVYSGRVTMTKSYAKAIDCDNVEAVIICTPPASHYRLCEEAIRRRKHVWVEKPFCADGSQAKGVVDRARASNLTVFPDFTYLFNPLFRLIRDIIRVDCTTTNISVESSRCNCHRRGSGHSVLADLAVHDFSILYFLFADRMRNCKPEISLLCASRERCALSLAIGDVAASILVDWMGSEKVRDFFVRTDEVDLLYSVDPATSEETLQVRSKRGTPDRLISSRQMNDALTTACKSFHKLIRNQEQDLELLNAALFTHECLKSADSCLRKAL